MLAGLGAVLVAGDAGWHALSDAAGVSSDISIVLRDVPAAAGFALVIAAVSGAPAAAPAWRPLAGLGVVSYGFYLWHVPVLLFLRGHGLLPLNPAGAALVGGAASLAVAVASWRLVERPAIAWARGIPRAAGRVVPGHVVDGRDARRGSGASGRAVRARL
jgi:peptidoglycan/LPS O-acetylase OafA/YrhL